MRKGEKCILKCREDYAYGSKGSPPKIPSKATLIFEVKLNSTILTQVVVSQVSLFGGYKKIFFSPVFSFL